jgi:tetratricopeptide (TPR) repeat protein
MRIVSQELFHHALHLEEDGHLEAALGVWRELAASTPTRNVFIRLGGAAKELGRIEEAQQAFAEALEIDPQSSMALVQLGIIAIHQCEYETAEKYLRRARRVEERPSTLTLLGVALDSLGNDLEAEEVYRQAIRLDPDYEEAYFNLGVVLRQDRPSEANQLFRKALDLDPDYAPAHRELGWLLHERGSSADAEVHLRRAVALDSGNGWAHIYLGTVIWDADADSAIGEFQVAHKLDPKWTVPLWSLGNIHEFVVRDYSSARSFFERALTLDPDDVVTLTNLGRLCTRLGLIEIAKAHLHRALMLDPGYTKARELLERADSGVPMR